VMPKVIVDARICRSTVDVQLLGYIGDSNPSALLDQNINSFNTIRHSQRWPRAVFVNHACSVTFEPFHPLELISLCFLRIVLTFLCLSRRVLYVDRQ
jgi:hypothetical protein